jgi:hypothetical protein
MTTSTWVSLLLAAVAGLLTLAQGVFWFEIRSLKQADRDLATLIQDVQRAQATCQRDHDHNGATKVDVARVEGSVNAVHKRLDNLFQWLAEGQRVRRPE